MAECPHICDVEFMPKGLHDLGSQNMLPRIQERIDACSGMGYDAILLVYGLCNNGIAGISSGDTRIVVPRAHDCITLFMGSSTRYAEYFNSHPGVYYMTSGWIERNNPEGAGGETVPRKLGLFINYPELVEKYGEENAVYIMETMGNGTANYDRMTFIRMGIRDENRFREIAREESERRGWQFEEIEGDRKLLEKLFAGNWDSDFLVLEPGSKVVPSYDERIIKSQ